MSLIVRSRPLFARAASGWWPAALMVVLCLPALDAGYILDDHFHQFLLENRQTRAIEVMVRQPHRLYSFMTAEPAFRRYTREVAGTIPWYAGEGIHADFMRPLSSWLLTLDWLVAPRRPVWAHVHSLIWMAALVLVVAAIFRRLFAAPWVAGLATLLFAVEDAHAFPAAWIANRNATVALTFGGLALLCHIRWRREGSRICAWSAPIFLGLGLLAGEAALSITAYLFAYAVFLDGRPQGADQAPLPRPGLAARLGSLAPCAAVSVFWVAAYSALGYGTSGSSMYIDPLRDPAGYFAALPPRLLALLLGQLAGVDPTVLFFLPEKYTWAFAALALVVVGGILGVCGGLLRHSPLARFFLAGMVISALPQCATFTHDRLLLAVGIGGLGLVTLLIAGLESARGRLARHPEDPGGGEPTRDHGAGGEPVWASAQRYWTRRSVRALAVIWIALHLVLAPLTLPLKVHAAKVIGRTFDNASRTLDRVGPLRPEMTVVFVTGPDFFFTSWAPLIRHQLGLDSVEKIRVLGTAIGSAVHITRADARSLRLSASPGSFHTSPFDTLMLDPLHRRDVGERHRTGQIEVEVLALSAEGLPTELRFRFPRDLDELAADSAHALVVWRKDGYHRFAPPRVGQSVEIEATSLMDLLELGLRPPPTRPPVREAR